MITIKIEQVKNIILDEKNGELTIEYCCLVDKKAVSKVVLKVKLKEVYHKESFTYL